MGVVEETRQVVQNFIAPELRGMRGILSGIDRRLDSVDKRLDSQDKRLGLHEEAVRARFDNIIQRLETVQQSFAFDKRLSDLGADKRRSA